MENKILSDTVKTKKEIELRKFISKYSIYFIFLVIVLFLTIVTGGKFLTPNNILNIIRQTSVIGLIAFGVTLIIITHGIDLSSGSILALVSVVVASLVQTGEGGVYIRYPNLPVLPIFVPLLIGLLLGAILGFSNGSLVVWGKIPPFISTLGMMTTARGLAFIYATGRPLSSLSADFNIIGKGFLLSVPNPVWIFLFFGFLTHIILSNTKLGKYIYAIGANPQAAYVSGINTNLCTLFVYVFAGLLTAVASIVLTARIGSGQAGLGLSYELFAIASAVIGGTSLNGGKGSIPETFVGALLIGIIKNGMDILNVLPDMQQVVLGVIIIGAVIIDQKKNKVAT